MPSLRLLSPCRRIIGRALLWFIEPALAERERARDEAVIEGIRHAFDGVLPLRRDAALGVRASRP